jgi:hypothetical protein
MAVNMAVSCELIEGIFKYFRSIEKTQKQSLVRAGSK